MEIALLLVSVSALVMACVSIACFFFIGKDIKRRVEEALMNVRISEGEFKAKTKELAESSQALGQLHNDQIAKVKMIGERIETLELRFHGTNPQNVRRG